MRKFNMKNFCQLASLSLGLCYAGAATAQTQENVVVVLDQTGTMQSPVAGGTEAKWEVAKKLAKDFVALPHSDREYELWTFNGSSWTRHYSFANGAGKSVSQRQTEVINLINGLSCTPNLTPLAMTICDAIDALVAHEQLVFPPPNKRVALYTDGLENNTPSTHACYGPASATIYNAAVTPRGGLTADSWQWKVLNKAITGSPTSTSSPPAGFEVLVDIAALFDVIPTSAGNVSTPTGEVGPMGMIYSSPMSALADMKFFQGLAQASGGRYTQIDPATPPPTPGDVDGSGCTNYADYVQVMQWYGQPVTVPHSDLADLTRDGWVNYSDYLVVVQNWGAGPNC